jgi:hypothetical protein
MNPPNHEHTLFIFDFAANIGREPALIRIDFARYQRATEGSDHSPGGRGDDVIDRGRMRFADLVYIDAIVLGDRAMDTEYDGLFFAWQICKT